MLNKKEKFIIKSHIIHNNKYDYSLINNIKNVHDYVNIICLKHGIFNQRVNSHVNGNGCSKCKFDEKRLTLKLFISKSKLIHGEKYDYSMVNYKNTSTKIKIICPTHGVFEQLPDNHIGKKVGCPYCKESHGEKEIRIFLDNNNIKYIRQKKFKECKDKRQLPFDFYLPDYNICIEFDGKQHYTNDTIFNQYFDSTLSHDKIKNDYCLKNSIKLVRIKYDENIIIKLQHIKNVNILI